MPSATSLGSPNVESFAPLGEAKGVRQAVATFSEPMVEFGDPRLEDPFVARCEGDRERLKGKGRWADTQHWVYDFEADLPAGQRCRFALKPDVKSAGGQPLAGKREFEFNTGGPAVVASLPREGNTYVDEEQAFVLAFDAPLDPASPGTCGEAAA